MSEQKKQNSFSFPNMPPPPADELEIPKKPNIFKRKTAKRIGALLLGSLIVAHPLAQIDHIAAAGRYQPDSVEIIQAAGSEVIPKGGTEWLVIGGYGQKYATNAAQELFNALGHKEVVASLVKPNQGYTIQELAEKELAYIHERGMTKLNVVGVSLGTPLELQVLSYIQENSKIPYAEYQNILYSKQGLAKSVLPEIGYWGAYSSPADDQDARQGDLAKVIVNILDKTGYEPGLMAKFVFASFDGRGDGFRSLNILNPIQWSKQQIDNLQETLNETPISMVVSDMRVAANMNVDDQWSNWGNVFTTGSHFVYISPNGPDDTVDNTGAYKKYSIMLQHYDVPSTLLQTNEPGHANTGASAIALSAIMAAQSELSFDSDKPIGS